MDRKTANTRYIVMCPLQTWSRRARIVRAHTSKINERFNPLKLKAQYDLKAESVRLSI